MKVKNQNKTLLILDIDETLVFATDKQLEGYFHIGTCVTGQKAGNRPVGQPINYAIEEIQKCACMHGGDIVKITDFKQTTGQNVIEGGIKSDPNDPVQKLVYEDFITGEVYVEKVGK